MRVVSSLATGLTLALACPACGDAPSAPVAAVPSDFYGLNAQLAFSPRAHGWNASAAQIAGLGVGVVRKDAFWSAIEPSPPRGSRHRYRWRGTDRLVRTLAAHGLRWYPIADYGTPWAASGNWQAPPGARHVQDYGAFVGALARRYGRDGRFWRLHPRLRALPVEEYEIWNEPNVRRFWRQQSIAATRLASMYLAAQRRAKAEDPEARVVIGGLSVVGVRGFLASMVRARPRLADTVDAVGFHPYGGGDEAGLDTTYARIRTLRAAVDRLIPGRDVPIEITETGWAVPPVPESWRATRLRRLAIELPHSNCTITRFIVHAWTSPETRRHHAEDWFGIARRDGTLRPSGRALRAGVRTMARPHDAPPSPLSCDRGGAG